MFTSKNGKTSAKDRLIASRLETLEQAVSSLQRRSPETSQTAAIGISSFVETCELAAQLLQNAPSLVKAMVEDNVVHIRVDSWPKAFARVLIDGGLRCDESRREAVRRYVEVLDDTKRHQQYLSQAHGKQAKLLKDSVARWERQLKYLKETLDNLGVEEVDVALGASFDPELHTVDPVSHPANGTIETKIAEEHHTIAAVQRPLFVWRDENGSSQCVPADVSVYVLSE